MADWDGHCYLASTLGEHLTWVRNVRAASGRATHRGSMDCQPGRAASRRARIIWRYLQKVPGRRIEPGEFARRGLRGPGGFSLLGSLASHGTAEIYFGRTSSNGFSLNTDGMGAGGEFTGAVIAPLGDLQRNLIEIRNETDRLE